MFLCFFPTWRRTFFSPGLYVLYKQVLDSMMHWNKMKQLSSEGQSTFHFHEFLWYAPFIAKFRILPASDVNQHSRLFYPVIYKNISEGRFYMYTYPRISVIHTLSLPDIWNLHWRCCSTALLQMSNWELSGLCKIFLNAWTNDNNLVFEIAVSSSVCLWYLQPEKKKKKLSVIF